jgi:hypothetical protein
MAGALVALRDAGTPVSPDALRTHLMVKGWSGKLIDRTVTLAARVKDGQTPRHRPSRPGLARSRSDLLASASNAAERRASHSPDPI